MKITAKNINLSLFAFGVLALSACASPARAPMAVDASASQELAKIDEAIQEADAKHYRQLSPTNFERAVDQKDSAKERLAKGQDSTKILNDVAAAKDSLQKAELMGAAHAASVQGMLNARQRALDAGAQVHEEKLFRAADETLTDMGKQMEAGKFKLNAKKSSELEKNYGAAEVGARKVSELREARVAVEKAVAAGAKKKTPSLYQQATSRLATAANAIELSPHTPNGYKQAVDAANQSALRLTEVLAIANQKGASEEVSLALWTQNQQLVASQAALTKANVDSKTALRDANQKANDVLASSQANAAVEQEKLESRIDEKNAKLDTQSSSIAALKTENSQYADEEVVKQRYEDARKTFATDEAEVMKDGKNIVVRLKKMQFTSGGSDLNPISFETLKKVDDLIAAVPVSAITVEGHTDSVGSNNTNKQLSEKRAESVRKYLVSQGLPEDVKVETAGYGSDKPLVTNKTKIGRATNRRVDIVIETQVVL